MSAKNSSFGGVVVGIGGDDLLELVEEQHLVARLVVQVGPARQVLGDGHRVEVGGAALVLRRQALFEREQRAQRRSGCVAGRTSELPGGGSWVSRTSGSTSKPSASSWRISPAAISDDLPAPDGE